MANIQLQIEEIDQDIDYHQEKIDALEHEKEKLEEKI